MLILKGSKKTFCAEKLRFSVMVVLYFYLRIFIL